MQLAIFVYCNISQRLHLMWLQVSIIWATLVNGSWNEVSWMDMALYTTIKVTYIKSGPFEQAKSMCKWPVGFVHIVSIIYYLIYLPNPFPRGV